MSASHKYDVVVVGGGPAGATAATELARGGHAVVLLDRARRIKPCGGAIPPRLISDFAIPDHLLVARATAARMIAPSSRAVEMPIDGVSSAWWIARCSTNFCACAPLAPARSGVLLRAHQPR